jgi:hypothetical protein
VAIRLVLTKCPEVARGEDRNRQSLTFISSRSSVSFSKKSCELEWTGIRSIIGKVLYVASKIFPVVVT